MIKNLGKVLSTYKTHTRPYLSWALGTIGSYTTATCALNVVAPFFAASVLSKMTNAPSEVFSQFYWLVFSVFIAQFFYRLGDWCMVTYENKSIVALEQKSIEAILAQPHHFFANNHSGALIARMTRFVKSFEGMFDSIAYTFLFSSVEVIGIFFVLFFKSIILGAVLLTWAAIYMLVSVKMARLRIPVDSQEAEFSSELTATAADIIGNASTVLIFGQRRKEIQHFQKQNVLHGKAQKRSWFYSNLQNGIQAILTASLEIGSLFIGILLWTRGLMTVADVALVYFYMRIISNSMWEVGRTFVRFTKYNTDAHEMVEIFEKKPEVDLSAKYEEHLLLDGSVILKDLTFSYSIGKNVFNDMNLVIQHGQHVGIVGTTGAGKTTLIAMLMKLRDPTNGIIEIGRNNISKMEHDSLRRQIAIVPQDVSLLHRTIFDNIAYGKAGASLDEVISVSKKAHIHDEIESTPDGYQTIVGERGLKLSGGQRQRIAIARALLIDAKIIILDEATSSLDAITETHIQDILQNELNGRTVIIIAHRLATIRHCDRIIVLNDGKIAEDGTHDQLMVDEGTYATLVQHQFSMR